MREMARTGCAGLIASFLFACNSIQLDDSYDGAQMKVDISGLIGKEKEIVKNAPANSNNKLAFDLYKELKENDNITYSPFSISLALSMAYAGAQGQTESDMRKVLHFGDNNLAFHKSYGQFAMLLSNKDRSVNETTLNISNVQWLQKDYTILKEYRDVLENSYGAAPVFLDFINEAALATKTINDKVSEQTEGEIPELLKSQLSMDTRFVLTNALYFNAKWENEFKKFQTSKGDFTNKDTKQKAHYMKQIHSYPYMADNEKQVLLMPYRDEDFAAVFILPKEGNLDAVELNLSADGFKSLFDAMESTKVDLWLPKFSQKMTPNMKEVLTKLGLGLLFDEQKVDLSKINGVKSGLEKLHISDVVHEAVVKMYEAGTTAAAATAIIGVRGTAMPAPSEPVIFHATRPFLFFIIHKESKLILFMGRVDNPEL